MDAVSEPASNNKKKESGDKSGDNSNLSERIKSVVSEVPGVPGQGNTNSFSISYNSAFSPQLPASKRESSHDSSGQK